MNKKYKSRVRSLVYLESKMKSAAADCHAGTSLFYVIQGVNVFDWTFQDDVIFTFETACVVPGKPGAKRRCSACQESIPGNPCYYYCDKACQKVHWPIHKVVCPKH